MSQIDQQARFIRFLERAGRLNRAIEFLPTDDEIQERKARGIGLTSPEMAVLLAYSKMWLSDELMASDLPEDPWIATALERYFPALLREKFGGLHLAPPAQARDHRHLRAQQHGQPGRRDLRPPAQREHRREAGAGGARLPG